MSPSSNFIFSQQSVPHQEKGKNLTGQILALSLVDIPNVKLDKQKEMTYRPRELEEENFWFDTIDKV